MILDTDILVDLDRKHPAAVRWVTTLPRPPIVSGIAALELLAGARDLSELSRLQAFLAPYPLAWPTTADLQEAYASYAALRLTHGTGLLDSLIAATAIGRGEPVATFNKKHFEAVPGLTTVQPYTH